LLLTPPNRVVPQSSPEPAPAVPLDYPGPLGGSTPLGAGEGGPLGVGALPHLDELGDEFGAGESFGDSFGGTADAFDLSDGAYAPFQTVYYIFLYIYVYIYICICLNKHMYVYRWIYI